jgi:O-antigen ligase
VGLQIFSEERTRAWYLRALVIAGFVIAVIAPLQLYTSDGRIFWLFEVDYSNIAMGPFVYPNQFAAFIELLLPIALTQVFADRAGWKTFHGLAAVVMYAAVLASASRTGFALASVEILVVPLLAARRTSVDRRQLLVSAAIFLGMLVVLGLAVGPERLIGKLQQKDPFSGRREYVESSLRMFRDRPLLGVGMGDWSAAYPAYATFDEGYFVNQAHNDWAQWAVEGGLPFVLMMLSVAVWCFPRALKTGWGLGVEVVFLHCLVDYPIQRMGVALVMFSLIGAIAGQGARGASARQSRK